MTKISIIPSITLALALLSTCVAQHERVSTNPHQENSNRTKIVPSDDRVEIKTGGLVAVEPSNETSTLEMAGVFAPPISDIQPPAFQSADTKPRGVNENKPNLPADNSETGSTNNKPRKAERRAGDDNHKGNGGTCDDEDDDDDGDDGDNAPKPSSDVNLVRDPRPDSQEHRWTSCMNLEDCYVSNIGPTILEDITSDNKTAPTITFVQDNDKTTTTFDDTIQEKAAPITFVQDNDKTTTEFGDATQDITKKTRHTDTTGCESFDVPNGKLQTANGTHVGDAASLLCNHGYKLEGESMVTCLPNGEWSQAGSCVVIDCGKPTIANGEVAAPEGTTFGRTATLSCDKGYTLRGSKTIKCSFNGKWNGSATCKPRDCGSPVLKNGRVIAPEGTTFGSIATLVCDNGYIEHGHTTIRCLASGKWDGSATCIPNECGKLKIANGKMTAPEGTTFGRTATLSCDNGYELHGSKTVTCSSDGKWNMSSTCKPKDCGKLTIANGKMTAPEGTTFGRTATVSCDKGYTLHGSKTVKCSSDGKWDGSGTCEPKDCGQLLIMNADISAPEGTTYGKSASIECRYGYTQHGDRTQTCTASGQWDGYTTCTPRECGTPIVPSSVKITHVSGEVYGSWFEFECKPGYYKYNPHRTRMYCNENGLWDIAYCDPVVCGTLPKIDNSRVTLDDGSYTFGSTAQFRCNNGFELKDGTSGYVYPFTTITYICAANGQWWISSRVKSQAITCTEKNECLSNPCMNNGKCEDKT